MSYGSSSPKDNFEGQGKPGTFFDSSNQHNTIFSPKERAVIPKRWPLKAVHLPKCSQQLPGLISFYLGMC